MKVTAKVRGSEVPQVFEVEDVTNIAVEGSFIEVLQEGEGAHAITIFGAGTLMVLEATE